MTPWATACQAPLSVGFSRQEYQCGLPFPSPGVCVCIFTDYIHIHTHSDYFQKVFQEYYKKRHIQNISSLLELQPQSQGSPTHRSQTGTSLRPVRNRATQQEVRVRQVSGTPSTAPQCSPFLALPPEPLTFPLLLTPFEGKLSSTRPIPGAEKVGNCFFLGL